MPTQGVPDSCITITPSPVPQASSAARHTLTSQCKPSCRHTQLSPSTILPSQPSDPSFCHAASLATAPSGIQQTTSDLNFKPQFAPSTKPTPKTAEHLIKQKIIFFKLPNNRCSMNLLPYLLTWKYKVGHYSSLLQFLYIRKTNRKQLEVTQIKCSTMFVKWKPSSSYHWNRVFWKHTAKKNVVSPPYNPLKKISIGLSKWYSFTAHTKYFPLKKMFCFCVLVYIPCIFLYTYIYMYLHTRC